MDVDDQRRNIILAKGESYEKCENGNSGRTKWALFLSEVLRCNLFSTVVKYSHNKWYIKQGQTMLANRVNGKHQFSLVVAAVLFFAGCGNFENYVPGPEEAADFSDVVVPVRYMMIHKPGLKNTREFYPGQVPAVRIQCHNGEVKAFLLFKVETKKLIMGREFSIQPGKCFYQPFPKLSTGTYIVVLRGTGDAEDSLCKFEVLERMSPSI